jgi:hypothetical protein
MGIEHEHKNNKRWNWEPVEISYKIQQLKEFTTSAAKETVKNS